jgi:hypothetical protein
MRAVATCRVTVLRGETTTALGDPADASTPVQDRVPFSILEQRRQTTRRADDRAQTVLYFTGRCSPRIDVRQGDRLQDESTGTIYLVTAVSRVASPIGTNDTRCDLEKVTDGTLS